MKQIQLVSPQQSLCQCTVTEQQISWQRDISPISLLQTVTLCLLTTQMDQLLMGGPYYLPTPPYLIILQSMPIIHTVHHGDSHQCHFRDKPFHNKPCHMHPDTLPMFSKPRMSSLTTPHIFLKGLSYHIKLLPQSAHALLIILSSTTFLLPYWHNPCTRSISHSLSCTCHIKDNDHN